MIEKALQSLLFGVQNELQALLLSTGISYCGGYSFSSPSRLRHSCDNWRTKFCLNGHTLNNGNYGCPSGTTLGFAFGLSYNRRSKDSQTHAHA